MKEWLAGIIRKDGKGMSWLFWLGLAGMLLILASDLFSEGNFRQAKADAAESQIVKMYTEQTEARLQRVLSQIEGAGKTSVMITLDSSEETIYAIDQKTNDNISETSHIIIDTSQGESALVEMTWQPAIRGVAVVCQGGDNIAVTSRITEMVSVLLGVSSNRISVAKMS